MSAPKNETPGQRQLRLAKAKAYRDRPEVKARRRAYQKAWAARPEVKARRRAYQKAWAARPEVKARGRACGKAYWLRPEVKARRRAYMKAYEARPEVKARKKAYLKAYEARPEAQARKRARDLKSIRGLGDAYVRQCLRRQNIEPTPEAIETLRLQIFLKRRKPLDDLFEAVKIIKIEHAKNTDQTKRQGASRP